MRPRQFRCIAMDPPWAERGSGKCKRGADRHYPVMGKTRIRDTVLSADVWRPAKHAHLYLWATNNKLVDALWLMDQLDFRYVTNVVWAKASFGLGQYFRGQHELLLFGVRGDGQHPSVLTKRRDLPTCPGLIDHVRDGANRKVHSAKPAAFRRLIERRSKGPRLEMFARGTAPRGWTFWGNQVAA